MSETIIYYTLTPSGGGGGASFTYFRTFTALWSFETFVDDTIIFMQLDNTQAPYSLQRDFSLFEIVIEAEGPGQCSLEKIMWIWWNRKGNMRAVPIHCKK